MEPLSLRVRRAYLIGFAVLWAILIPAVLLYADGWRFKEGFGLVRTGGIFVSVPLTDATVSLGETVIGKSSFLNRGLFINDLAPSSYVVTVKKKDYQTWKRTLVVEPQVVTDVHVLLVPDQVDIVPLTVGKTSTTSTSTRIISQETHDAYVSVFVSHTAASSTVPVGISDSVALFIEKGNLTAKWMRHESPPLTFCGRPSFCVNEIPIDVGHKVTRAVFYKGGIVYRTESGRIFFAELDVRPDPVKVTLYNSPKADFSVIDGNLIIKDGAKLYQVNTL